MSTAIRSCMGIIHISQAVCTYDGLSGQFFEFFKSFCLFVAATCDLVYAVEAIFHLL